jgi:hypothetical protein
MFKIKESFFALYKNIKSILFLHRTDTQTHIHR